MNRGIEVKLDRKRHLLASSQAIAKYQEITGRELAARTTISNLSLRDVIVITWALLLHEDPGLTIDGVGDMIFPLTNMKELMYKIAEAWDVYGKELEK